MKKSEYKTAPVSEFLRDLIFSANSIDEKFSVTVKRDGYPDASYLGLSLRDVHNLIVFINDPDFSYRVDDSGVTIKISRVGGA